MLDVIGKKLIEELNDMALTAKVGGSAKKDMGRVEEGTHVARVVQIIDLGMQQQTDWQTGEDRTYDDGNPMIKPEVFITFEFPTERIEVDGEDKPRWLSKRYTLSMHEKSALTALIHAIDPKGAKSKSYNISKLLDKPLMISVGSTKNDNAKVTGVAGVPKGLAVDPLENEARIFDMEEFDMEVYEALPGFLQELIQESKSFKGFPEQEPKKTKKAHAEQPEVEEEEFDEDTPF